MRSKKMKSRNKILAAVGAAMAAFIVYTIVVYTIRGWQWDSLFPYVLGVGGVADVMTAVIAITDKAVIAITDKKERRKESDEAEIDQP